MVGEDHRLVVAERVGDALALLDVEDDAGVVVEEAVVGPEGAGVLRERVEQPAERRPALAVHGVRVGGGHDVGPGGVDLGVDGEGRAVDRPVALDHLAVVVDENEVAHPHMGERLAEGVDPEVVGPLRVAGRDVAGDALLVAEVGEEPEGGRQALLAVEPFLLRGLERRRQGKAELRHGDTVPMELPRMTQEEQGPRARPSPVRTSPRPSNRP